MWTPPPAVLYTPPLPDKAPAPKAASVEGSREVKYTTKSAHMVMNQRAMYDGLTLKIRKEIKRHGHGHDDDDDDDDCVSIRVGTAISTLVCKVVRLERQIGSKNRGGSEVWAGQIWYRRAPPGDAL